MDGTRLSPVLHDGALRARALRHAEAGDAVLPGPELSVIVPTFREHDNVGLLVKELASALGSTSWEVVFVDDNSPDETADAVRRLARQDRRVRIIHRVGRRGLSSAVVEGILSTSAPYVAVMDADLQHDARLLPAMLGKLKDDEADIVVGSRYAVNGSTGDWNARRAFMSRLATRLSHITLKTELEDPMSGFFMLSRSTFHRALDRLSIQGYKILLDIIASSPSKPRVKELPYTFRERRFGESKLDSVVVVDYLLLLVDKLLGGAVPVRFVLFSIVGGLGVFVHMAVLSLLFKATPASFLVAQSAATVCAMTFNFFLNNILTYRDRRLIGARQLLVGLASFYAVCSIGAVANVGIANALFDRDYQWWVAGVFGIVVGAVWNYAATSFYTWRMR